MDPRRLIFRVTKLLVIGFAVAIISGSIFHSVWGGLLGGLVAIIILAIFLPERRL